MCAEIIPAILTAYDTWTIPYGRDWSLGSVRMGDSSCGDFPPGRWALSGCRSLTLSAHKCSGSTAVMTFRPRMSRQLGDNGTRYHEAVIAVVSVDGRHTLYR